MPVATLVAARNLVMSHFKTLWDAQTPPVPLLIYDDRHQDLPANAPFARIAMRHGPMDQRTFGNTGNRRFRRFGIITVQIFALANQGLATADLYAKVALDAFEGQNTAPDEIHFRNTRVNEIGQDGPWFQINVISEFDYDELK
jgi:hypothetical protein